jgi:1-aminocyclopropane-1-carboxylate deaminase/D-cysteine desulfhydrase-like pyridoxal-dependent ACC family enzyme
MDAEHQREEARCTAYLHRDDRLHDGPGGNKLLRAHLNLAA